MKIKPSIILTAFLACLIFAPAAPAQEREIHCFVTSASAGDASLDCTDGDEPFELVIPAILLPRGIKKGDPIKLIALPDESRRAEANERMRVREDKLKLARERARADDTDEEADGEEP